MKKTNLTKIITLIVLFFSCYVFSQERIQYERVIVVFEENIVNRNYQVKILEKYGGIVIKPLNLINGWAVYLPDRAKSYLSKKSGIKRIDKDLILRTFTKQSRNQIKEVIPWGIKKIGADAVWEITKGEGIKVAILDTGIDLSHPDLYENIKGEYNAINPKKSANDDNGHGTHIAGIIAAGYNGIGVIGVGPRIHLYAVKILNKNGSGWLSDLIEGIEWCINNGIQIINMSFGTPYSNLSFYEAILSAYNCGIVLVAAAGNNGGNLLYPAAFPEVIAVGCCDINNNIPLWCNSGSIDIIAPGVEIFSTYKNGTYATLSGTSMATAFVSGSIALILSMPVDKNYDLDNDDLWDIEEIRDKLKEAAQDLNYPPEIQGAGLLRIDLSLQY